MICGACAAIPLDLFLPLQAKATRFKDGKAWHGAYMLFEGADALDRLAQSAAAGCVLCAIVSGALDKAEPLWATKQFMGKGHNMLLHAPRESGYSFPVGVALKITQEGEMVVSDGRRTGGVYWELEGLGYGLGRAIVNRKADCEENFSLARNWLDTCVKEHASCQPPAQGEAFLPTRLVYLNSDEDGIMHPRLVMPSQQNIDAQSTRYFALSHCWGTERGKQVPRTTKGDLAHHLEQLDAVSLPKTFTEAMHVTHQMGVQYLWIDSLCIIQDDKDDFTTECGRMHLIYSRAHCTIAASDSPDGDGGCFLPRDADKIQPCKLTLLNQNIPYRRSSIMDIIFGRFPSDPAEAAVTIHPNFGPWINSLRRGAVSSRGWCLQERELSPRLLHFTRDRLLWECRACTASEDEPRLEAKRAANEALAPHLSRFRVLDDQDAFTYSNARTGVKTQVHKWDRIVEAYSEKRLSVGTDRLPAISGIAAAVARWHAADDVYLAGIWRSNLLKGLAWFPKKTAGQMPVAAETWPPRSADEDMPSWSWAAHDGAVSFCGESWFSGSWTSVIGPDGNEEWVKSGPEVTVESASTTLASTDVFGRVSGGQVTLVGWAAEITISEEDLILPASSSDESSGEGGELRRGEMAGFTSKRYSAESSTPGVTVYFDHDVANLPRVQLVCLQLGTGKSVSGSGLKADVGLVLRKVSPDRGDAYERLGMFDVAGDGKSAWQTRRQKGAVTII